MQAIIDTIVAFGDWLLGLVKAVFTSVWDMFDDAFCWVVDKLLSVAVSLVGSVDTSGVSLPGSWQSLPSEVLNIMGLLGFGQCMAIITAALTIRFGLQLIPFVRLGS